MSAKELLRIWDQRDLTDIDDTTIGLVKSLINLHIKYNITITIDELDKIIDPIIEYRKELKQSIKNKE